MSPIVKYYMKCHIYLGSVILKTSRAKRPIKFTDRLSKGAKDGMGMVRD